MRARNSAGMPESLRAAVRDALRDAQDGRQPSVPAQRRELPASASTGRRAAGKPGHRREQRGHGGGRGRQPNVTQPLRRRGG